MDWCQNNLHRCEVKCRIFVHFILRWAVVELRANFEWPQISLICSIFVRFALWRASFESRPNFRKSAPNDPKWPWHVQGQNTNMHVTYTPEAQIFVCFALRWAVFELRPNFRKSAPNDPKWPWHVQGQIYQHACYIHPRGPNFRPFRSTMSRFWVTAQFLEKCTEWPQMTLTCSRSKIPTCMLHTPLRPKFPSVSLYDEPFSRKLRFLNFPLVTM